MDRREFIKGSVLAGVFISTPTIALAKSSTKIVEESFFGEKTLKESGESLEKINLRRLQLQIGKIIDDYMWSFNDASTRLEITNRVNALLDVAKSNYIIGDYLVICDETTNRQKRIDANQLMAHVIVKPYNKITKLNWTYLLGQRV